MNLSDSLKKKLEALRLEELATGSLDDAADLSELVLELSDRDDYKRGFRDGYEEGRDEAKDAAYDNGYADGFDSGKRNCDHV